MPVPNSLIRNPSNDHLTQWIGIVKPSAIVLSGGNNIGEFNLRDQTEAQLIKYAKHKGLPLLGICRGMQMLAHFHGSVIQPLKGHVGTRHNLEGEVNWSVNSFHVWLFEIVHQTLRFLPIVRMMVVSKELNTTVFHGKDGCGIPKEKACFASSS